MKVTGDLDLQGRSGLEILNVITKAIYDARTGENVGADTLEKHAGELQGTLDAMQVDDTDWGVKLSALMEQHAQVMSDQKNLESTLTQEVMRVMERAESYRNATVSSAQNANNTKLAQLKKDAEDAIRRINEQLRSDTEEENRKLGDVVGTADREMSRVIDEAKQSARQRLDAATASVGPVKEKLAADIAVAQQKRDQQASAQSTRNLIEAAQKDAGIRRDLQKRMTITLDKIRELKALIASRLPLPCTFSEGRICREENGVLVPLRKWNTASQYAFVLKLATLSHGAVGFVVVDKMEALDKEHREGFLEAANHYADTEKMQFICAFVGEGELKVHNEV